LIGKEAENIILTKNRNGISHRLRRYNRLQVTISDTVKFYPEKIRTVIPGNLLKICDLEYLVCVPL
jgi:hypothetical protein